MRTLIVLIILFAGISSCLANTPTETYLLKDGKVVYFVSAAEAKNKILEDRTSSYFNSLTYLDISIRMKKKELPNQETAMDDYKRFIGANVLDWQTDEINLMKKVLKDCQSLYQQVNPALVPDTMFIIKTTGSEEAESDYTRDNIIYLPQKRFSDLNNAKTHEKLGKIIIHELFHIYSRYHPGKREQLYQAIGFTKVPPVSIGAFLTKRRLTNPDATNYNYKINVKDKSNRSMEVMMMVYSKYAAFQEGKELKDHITFSLFEIKKENGSYKIINGKQPQAIDPNEVTGFFEQVGRNTHYIVHPDEILADNIRLIVLSKMDKSFVKHLNPEGIGLLDKIEAIIRE